MPLKRGFTYIELLVVLAILAIIASFAILAYGDFGQSRRIYAQARQLKSLLNLAQYQAILEPSIIGLQLSEKGYQFRRYRSGGSWEPIKKRLWRDRPWPAQTTYRLQVNQSKTNEPQILAFPSGELSAFTLQLYYQNNEIVVLTGKENGDIDINEAK